MQSTRDSTAQHSTELTTCHACECRVPSICLHPPTTTRQSSHNSKLSTQQKQTRILRHLSSSPGRLCTEWGSARVAAQCNPPATPRATAAPAPAAAAKPGHSSGRRARLLLLLLLSPLMTTAVLLLCCCCHERCWRGRQAVRETGVLLGAATA